MTESIKDMLPDLYSSFLHEPFDLHTPPTTLSTCHHCAMVCPSNQDQLQTETVAQGYFSPDVKCCSFFPRIPNYLLGALFANQDPAFDEGRERVKKIINSHIGVTPGWLGGSKKYYLLFFSAYEKSFGRSTTLRCPFFLNDSGLCSIWKFRETDCSTFFCKHDRGAESTHFWRTFENAMAVIETILANYAGKQVFPEMAHEVKRLGTQPQLDTYELEDKAPPKELYDNWWGEWSGREVAFYVKCYEVIQNLTQDTFLELIEGNKQLASLIPSFTKIQDEVFHPRIPESLVINPRLRTWDISEEHTVFSGYRRYHPIVMISEIKELLEYFEEEAKVEEVRQKILEKDEVDIPDEIFLQLYQFRILTTTEELA